ncbi:hypothetical protein Belba_0363 [Belliella baltica DSM 15883]|uniref:Outer membrane protein beta-barrel domain-containing protein n=1 Tax=Belliella baltica (strain DSM 15883 / CIP 108006 / LMG 21964 / BA134) TaxID=866536 RepID=I3Z1A8_BELBD|nr:hypothetical protein [Belliella baltica]AFL83026.1 hypothetical protein Belba_0363 [Belliella baltica DSM 15883]
MKNIFLTFLIIILGYSPLKAQKLDFNIGFGSYRVPNQVKYELPRAGFNMNFGLIYQINDKWEMGTAINHSVFNYDRQSLAGTPVSLGTFGTGGRVNSDHLYFILRRKISLPFNLEGSFGLGIGGYVENNEYLVAVAFDEERNFYRGVSWNRDIEAGLHFPVSYTLKKIFSNKVYLGLEGGAFFDKNLNTRGIFIGPKAGIFL